MSSVRSPTAGDQPVEVGAHHRVLGGGHRHVAQAFEFAERFFLHRLGHARGVDLLLRSSSISLLLVTLAQLALDGLGAVVRLALPPVSGY